MLTFQCNPWSVKRRNLLSGEAPTSSPKNCTSVFLTLTMKKFTIIIHNFAAISHKTLAFMLWENINTII